MELRFCPLYSGSSGNVVYAGFGDVHLLIDAGVSGAKITRALAEVGVTPQQLSGILVTHEHSDHISGVGILSRKYNLPIYATGGTWGGMVEKLGPVSTRNVREFMAGSDFYIGDIGIQPFSIPHDAADPVGFALTALGGKVSVATDIGCIREDWLCAVENSDVVLLEANHDADMLKAGGYPYALKKRILGKKGHLSNDDAGQAAVKLAERGVRSILLGHLSAENNFPELALETVSGHLREAGLEAELVPCLSLCWRDRVSDLHIVYR